MRRAADGTGTISVIRVHVSPRDRTRGLLRLGHLAIPCRLGRSGPRAMKREGDGASPIGSFRLLELRYRADRLRRPRTCLPVRIIRPDDGWCDDRNSPRYNRPIKLPSRLGHEEMARIDGLYDYVVVLDYNIRRRSIGRGSAIFFHLTQEAGRASTPTAGCVAITRAHMVRVLAAVGTHARMVIG